MSQPLSQRGQKRRQAILDAATDAFLQHGYEGTTLDMIIARAGGSGVFQDSCHCLHAKPLASLATLFPGSVSSDQQACSS